jgi:hypothetical protein
MRQVNKGRGTIQSSLVFPLRSDLGGAAKDLSAE